jgi:GNAT superfamily N-acetyltransferase
VDVRIRLATPADLPVLVRLLEELFSIEADFRPDPQRQRAGLALMLDDPRFRVVLVAERRSGVIGMVTGQLVVSTAEGGHSVLVEDMVVEEPERGRGVGHALLAALEGWAANHGATRLQLLADRENAAALAFYARAGWRPTQLVCWRRGGRPAAGTAQDARPLSGT